jgi:hypothetical protein
MTFLTHAAQKLRTPETRDEYFNFKNNMPEYMETGYISPTATRLRSGRTGVRMPVRTRDFSRLQNVERGSGAFSASLSMGTGVYALG